MNLEKYEDKIRQKKEIPAEYFSPFCDFRLVDSSITPGVKFAVRITKPEKPSYLVAGTHGWHMSVKKFEYMEHPESEYLMVDVDMRGRAFSTGTPDCNQLELYDVYDAVQFAKREYAQYLVNDNVIYFESGSGGGGNALAIAGKFPDLFSAVNALSPISDYREWYFFDSKYKEFRDEMDIWIGCTPEKSPEAYAARSGITLVPNLLTNVLICHGTEDQRVPYFLSEKYMAEAARCGKGNHVRLLALEGVGTREHYGNITAEQTKQMGAERSENFRLHKMPIKIPEKGRFIVCGYLVTKEFSVFLENTNTVAEIFYDLGTKKIIFEREEQSCKIFWHKQQ